VISELLLHSVADMSTKGNFKSCTRPAVFPLGHYLAIFRVPAYIATLCN